MVKAEADLFTLDFSVPEERTGVWGGLLKVLTEER